VQSCNNLTHITECSSHLKQRTTDDKSAVRNRVVGSERLHRRSSPGVGVSVEVQLDQTGPRRASGDRELDEDSLVSTGRPGRRARAGESEVELNELGVTKIEVGRDQLPRACLRTPSSNAVIATHDQSGLNNRFYDLGFFGVFKAQKASKQVSK